MVVVCAPMKAEAVAIDVMVSREEYSKEANGESEVDDDMLVVEIQ